MSFEEGLLPTDLTSVLVKSKSLISVKSEKGELELREGVFS